MTRIVSIGAMIEQLEGLLDTTDLTNWEHGFVTNVLQRYLRAGKDSRVLSANQVEVIERIWGKHFA